MRRTKEIKKINIEKIIGNIKLILFIIVGIVISLIKGANYGLTYGKNVDVLAFCGITHFLQTFLWEIPVLWH